MLSYIRALFTKHPQEVGETYIGHLCSATKIAIRLGVACPMQLLHAVFPFICPPLDSNANSLIQFLEDMQPQSRKEANKEDC